MFQRNRPKKRTTTNSYTCKTIAKLIIVNIRLETLQWLTEMFMRHNAREFFKRIELNSICLSATKFIYIIIP